MTKNIIIHTGENGVKEYLTQFFKELGVEEKDLTLKVDEAFKTIIENPTVPNIFGITVQKH